MRTRIILVFLAAGCSTTGAETQPSPAVPEAAQAPAPANDEAARLDQLTAPIALHPDALLAQMLMASTYPDEVVAAARWSKQHAKLTGDEAVKQAASQPWDPSVQSLVGFPQALAMMAEKPEWVKQLGEAFLSQPDAVMDSVQRLRQRAQAEGTLESNDQQTVQSEEQAIVIAPAGDLVYVPFYDPSVVYGAWPYAAYPPYYFARPIGYPIAAGVAFGAGIAARSALWGGFHWGRHDVNINVNRYNALNANRRLDARHASWTRNNQARIHQARAAHPAATSQARARANQTVQQRTSHAAPAQRNYQGRSAPTRSSAPSRSFSGGGFRGGGGGRGGGGRR
jgi:hypothetical protein